MGSRLLFGAARRRRYYRHNHHALHRYPIVLCTLSPRAVRDRRLCVARHLVTFRRPLHVTLYKTQLIQNRRPPPDRVVNDVDKRPRVPLIMLYSGSVTTGKYCSCVCSNMYGPFLSRTHTKTLKRCCHATRQTFRN